MFTHFLNKYLLNVHRVPDVFGLGGGPTMESKNDLAFTKVIVKD